MVMSLCRLATALLMLAVFFFGFASLAFACACCSERGSRVDRSVLLDPSTRTQVERMVFAKEAVVGDDNEPGLLPSGSSSSYALTMTRDKDVVTFALRDPLGRSGRLIFTMPARIWIFAVDPFGDAKDEGLGPLLYKEWRLTAPVKGDGIFRRAGLPGEKATLIFHGRGRGCTEAEHFSDWSLLLQGPAGKATFYGKLETPKSE